MNAGCVFGQLDAMHGDPGRGRLLAGGDVDVVEDLEVIREELQGHDQDLGDPVRARNPGKRSFTSGVSHSSGVCPALWYAKLQRSSSRPSRVATAAAVSRSWVM